MDNPCAYKMYEWEGNEECTKSTPTNRDHVAGVRPIHDNHVRDNVQGGRAVPVVCRSAPVEKDVSQLSPDCRDDCIESIPPLGIGRQPGGILLSSARYFVL